MTKTRKIFIGLGISVAVLILVGAAAIWWLLNKSLPVTRGAIDVRGLHQAVDIYRDQAGIPHILAANESDAWFAAGFVHAQDRLWQMDLARRLGQGRLAEIFGTAALDNDVLARTIGIARIADSLMRSVSPHTLAMCDAYSRGVNECIRESSGRLPIEFDILHYRPEPWTVRDCLILTRLMGWELALSWWVDLTLGDLVQTLGETKAREVFPWDPEDAPVIVPPEARYSPERTRPFQRAFISSRSLLHLDGSAIGSNCWAVTRTRSATGLPVLANDPHLLFMQPARWYAMHIQCPGLNAAGVTIPGAPGVVIGHDDRIAWGMTNVMADDVDFRIERVNLADSMYQFRGAMRRLRVSVDSIFVKDSSVVTLLRYETHHGPLIDRIHPVTRGRRAQWDTGAVSMQWAGSECSDEADAIYRLNRARSWDEFRAALSGFGVPAQNVIYADRQGNIGYQAAGRIPLRPAGVATLPSDGSDEAGEWKGAIPFDELPRAWNPSSDLLASANNKPQKDYPHHISNLWESESRITRILDMLGEQPAFRADDFRYLQMDARSNDASAVRDEFVRALQRMPDRPVELTRVLNLLSQWNLRMPASSVPACIFNVAYVHLLRETFQDEMGPELYRNYATLSNIPVRVMPKLLADTAATWFDNVRTAVVETKDDILRKSVMLALLDLSRRFGSDMNGWKWGRLHTVTFRHPLGGVAPLGRLFNVGPFRIGGNVTTVNNGEYSLLAPYDCTVGPSMRMIVDMASPDTCSLVLPTGQSGQPLSAHYADQSVLWQNGGYLRLVSNPGVVRNSGWERLVLRPHK